MARDLAAAKSSLMSAINSGDATLTKKIENVDAALAAAIAANAAADEATKAELVAKDETMTAELERLNTFVIVVCVVAGVGVAGCAGLLVWILIDKRKLIK